MSASTTVLVVDDHALVREGLSAVIDLHDDLVVVSTAPTVRVALVVHDEQLPDVVVTDLQLPDRTGLDIAPAHCATGDRGRPGHRDHARRRRADLRRPAGRRLRLRRQGRPVLRVVGAVRQAALAPRNFLCGGLLHAVARHQDHQAMALTEREHAVLLLLADGLGSAAIGERLYLAESTAKSLLTRTYHKLGAGHRGQALVTAMRVGLLSSMDPQGG